MFCLLHQFDLMLHFQETKCTICFVIKLPVYLPVFLDMGAIDMVTSACSRTVIFSASRLVTNFRVGKRLALRDAVQRGKSVTSWGLSTTAATNDDNINTSMCQFQAEMTVSSLSCLQTRQLPVIKARGISAHLNSFLFSPQIKVSFSFLEDDTSEV